MAHVQPDTTLPKEKAIQQWYALVRPSATPGVKLQFNTLGLVEVTQVGDVTTLESEEFSDFSKINIQITPIQDVGVGANVVYNTEYATNAINITQTLTVDEMEYNIIITKIN